MSDVKIDNDPFVNVGIGKHSKDFQDYTQKLSSNNPEIRTKSVMRDTLLKLTDQRYQKQILAAYDSLMVQYDRSMGVQERAKQDAAKLGAKLEAEAMQRVQRNRPSVDELKKLFGNNSAEVELAEVFETVSQNPNILEETKQLTQGETSPATPPKPPEVQKTREFWNAHIESIVRKLKPQAPTPPISPAG